MYKYSVQIDIEKSVEKEWLHYMQSTHIDDVLKTQCFISCEMRKSILQSHETKTSYSIEYVATSEERYKFYQAQYAPVLQADVKNYFEGKFTATRDFYEIIFEKK